MLSSIADLKKIEARGIKHVHDGRDHYNYLMILLSLKNGQLQYKSFEDDSLLLEITEWAHMVVLAQDIYMIDKFII